MIQEWNRWQGPTEESGDGDWVDGDWAGDWNEPSQAWDRYALMDSNLSKHSLEKTCPEQAQATGKGEPSKDTQRKCKSKPTKTPVDNKTAVGNKHADNTEQAEGSKKRKVEEDRKPEPVPTSEKDLVNTIAKYLKEIKGGGWKITGHQDLTEDVKRDFKKPFPPTEECRLNVYWKRPSAGVHIRSEKKDIATFAVDMECGPFLLRLHACLKAAALMATRNNLGLHYQPETHEYIATN